MFRQKDMRAKRCHRCRDIFDKDCAWYIELHDVNRIGKERDWLLLQIEDRYSSRRSFPGWDQFASEPETTPAVRAKMRVY